MELRSVDLAAVVNAALETVRPAAIAKKVHLRVDVDETLGRITADESRLQQIVWNLLSNGVKFTPEGGHVTLRVVRTPSHATITVGDSGRGIAASFLPHIFERFRQDDSSTTRQQAGLGLGLAIVRHLVELHGGKVSVHGEGRGATFEVCLPVHATPLDAALPDRESGALAMATPRVSGRLTDVRVLVVDDQEDTRSLVATVLEDAGANVSQAESVEAAMKILARSSISVIVSDVGMPGEDGFGFLRRVRASDLPGAPRVPALALTAYARAEDRQKALAAGFQEHVAKPIDPAKLLDVVAALAGR
jgi:CheY-like chemotaxis protein